MSKLSITSFVLTAALASFAISTADAQKFVPKVSASEAPVCVERLEDEGYPNIYGVSLDIDGRLRAAFAGGNAACFYLEPGDHKLRLHWPRFDWQRPDHGAANRVEESVVVPLHVVAQGLITLEICSTRDGKQNPHWQLRQRGKCP